MLMPSMLVNRRSHRCRPRRGRSCGSLHCRYLRVTGLSVGGLLDSRSPTPSDIGLAGYGITAVLSATSPRAKTKGTQLEMFRTQLLEMMKLPLSDRFCRNRKISWLPFSFLLGAGCFSPSLLVVTSVSTVCKPLSPDHASSRRRFTFQLRLSFPKTHSLLEKQLYVVVLPVAHMLMRYG
jgi:hypothetical protein